MPDKKEVKSLRPKIQVEIGGAGQAKPGWVDIDHKKGRFSDIMTDELPFEESSVDRFYMSHVIEHIPIPKAPEVFAKLYKMLIPGGTLRVVCPDLQQLAEAYVRGDIGFFERFVAVTDPQHNKLGIGGRFVNNIISVGSDTLLYDRTGREKLSGIAHIAAYDMDMMTALLSEAGFLRISRSVYDDTIDKHPHDGQLFVEATKGVY